jgi:hypothetical protein
MKSSGGSDGSGGSYTPVFVPMKLKNQEALEEWRTIPEDAILHSHRLENVKSSRSPFSLNMHNALTL